MDFSRFSGKKVIWTGKFKSLEEEDTTDSYILFEDGSGLCTSDTDGDTKTTILDDAKEVLNFELTARLEEMQSVFALGHALDHKGFDDWREKEITSVMHKKAGLIRAVKALAEQMQSPVTATDHYRASLDKAAPKGELQTPTGPATVYEPAVTGFSGEVVAALELVKLMVEDDTLVDEGASIMVECKERGVVIESVEQLDMSATIESHVDNVMGLGASEGMEEAINYPITDTIQEIPVLGVVSDEPKP